MRLYFNHLLLIISLIIVSAALLNWVIDPYGIWKNFELERFNKEKPKAHYYLNKRMQMRWESPEKVILGTSRAGAFSPSHPAFVGVNSLSWSMPAAPFFVTMKQFEYAQSKGQLKQAIIGLDFFVFNAYYQSPPELDDASPITNPRYDLLLNYDLLKSTFFTIKHNWRRTAQANSSQAVKQSSSQAVKQSYYNTYLIE